MAGLFEALVLPSGGHLKNRLCKSAMTEGLADLAGCSTGELEVLYRIWSSGGAGLLISGNIMVDSRFLERSGNLCADAPHARSGLAALAKAGTAAGNHFWAQLNHPGRQSNKFVSSQPLAPSEVQLKLGFMYAKPREMTEDDIQSVITAFARSARLVQDVGFTGVQIHAAHGYLGSQFLSPLTNQRKDHWGGSLENRARFLMETIRAVRQAVGPHFPIAVKLNSSDFQKGAFTMEDSLIVAQWVARAGVDLLEISGGTYEALEFMKRRRDSTSKREAFFIDYAQKLKAQIDIPLMITGGFRSREAMEKALNAGECQLIGIARPFCVQPDFPRAMQKDGQTVLLPLEEKLATNLSLSSSRFLSGLAGQAQAAWYYQQIMALARGQKPRKSMSIWSALLRFLVRDSVLALRRRLSRPSERQVTGS